MSESTQKKLGKNAPRVHIEYDVEIGDAIQKKEIPFIVGLLSDLSGNPKKPLPKVKDRNFVSIDRYNFNEVLKEMKPRLQISVSNKLIDYYKITDKTINKLSKSNIPSDIITKLETLKDKEYKNRKSFISALEELISDNIENEHRTKILSYSKNEKKFPTILTFDELDSFKPENVAEQVPEIKKLKDLRKSLSEILIKLDGNDDFDEIIQKIIKEPDQMKQILEEIESKKKNNK